MIATFNRDGAARERLAFFMMHIGTVVEIDEVAEVAIARTAVAAALAEAWASENERYHVAWTRSEDGTYGVCATFAGRTIARWTGIDAERCSNAALRRLSEGILAQEAIEALASWCGACLGGGDWTKASHLHEMGGAKLALCSTCDGLNGPDGIANIPGEIDLDAIILSPEVYGRTECV